MRSPKRKRTASSKGLPTCGTPWRTLVDASETGRRSTGSDVTRSVTLRDGRRVERIRIPEDSAHAVGIILVRPGRPSRTIYATDGPSTLQRLGPQAAAQYFDAAGCSRKDP